MTRHPDTLIAAFTEDHVGRLTGLTKRQLRHWDRIGFFSPSLAYEDRSRPLSRLYSFRDLVCLKVLDALRNEANVPLSHLRVVKDKLAHLGNDAWAKTTLYVLNRRVVFDNPETHEREEVVSGQGVLQIPLKVVTGDMDRAVRDLRRRDETSIGKIERKRGIAHSQPVVAGTRIPVRSIQAFADAGYSAEEILQEYPTLTRADIEAALDHDLAA